MGRKSLVQIRQKEIIIGFYKVARKEGLENASIAKVAMTLDVNPSYVMHYFKTKQDLIHGLIEYILERYRLIYDLGNCTGNSKDRLKKIIGSLFSREWDKLFDDGVFFSSYSLIFRDKTIKKHYKNLHDDLRQMLANILKDANENGVIEIDNVEKMADLIFILVEGAYYYLSMVTNRTEYNTRIAFYQKTVWSMLNIR